MSEAEFTGLKNEQNSKNPKILIPTIFCKF